MFTGTTTLLVSPIPKHARESDARHKCNEERGQRGHDRPNRERQTQELPVLTGRSNEQRMNIGANGESERADGYSEGDVQRGLSSRFVSPKTRVRDVRTVDNRAHDPRGEAPRLRVIGGDGEHDPHEGVADAYQNGRQHPPNLLYVAKSRNRLQRPA